MKQRCESESQSKRSEGFSRRRRGCRTTLLLYCVTRPLHLLSKTHRMTSLIRRALTRRPAPALSLPAMGDRQSPLNVPIQRSEFHSRNHGENSARNRRTKVHQRVGRCDLARVPGARPLRHSAQFFGQGAARSAQKKRPRIAEVRNSQFLYFVLTNLMGLPVYEPCVTPGTRNDDIYQNKGLLEKYPHP